MRNPRVVSHSSTEPSGRLARAVSSISGASARHPRTIVALWLVLIAGCIFAGASAGTKTLSNAGSGTGESARADAALSAAHLKSPAIESVLVSSGSARSTGAAVTALEIRARRLPSVASVQGPRDVPALSRAGGRLQLVQVQLRGDPDNADEHVAPLQRIVASVAAVASRRHAAGGRRGLGRPCRQPGRQPRPQSRRARLAADHADHPHRRLRRAGGGRRAAPARPDLGRGRARRPRRHLAHRPRGAVRPPRSSSSSGWPSGVDYSLFYIRREREERRAGRDSDAALTAATASVGRAIVVAALTVMVGLAGLTVHRPGRVHLDGARRDPGGGDRRHRLGDGAAGGAGAAG